MTDCEIVLSDIETLYLENLGTVEFDLDLPRAGKHGSTITWESDAPHFLDAEGRVTRPAYGRGNRIVTLTATFAHDDASEQHEYSVQVIEQNSDFVVEAATPSPSSASRARRPSCPTPSPPPPMTGARSPCAASGTRASSAPGPKPDPTPPRAPSTAPTAA